MRIYKKAWLQRFGPRRAKSGWSRINTRNAERLIEAGQDFLKRLSGNRKALAFFEGLNKANTYAIAYRLQTAKRPETREKRMLANRHAGKG